MVAGLADIEASRRLYRKQQELEAVIEDDTATEPERAEALTELEQVYEFQKRHALRSKNNADSVVARSGCLKSLDGCQVYLLIVASQYGTLVGRLSITHAEYRRAKEKNYPSSPSSRATARGRHRSVAQGDR